jgi:hypothetical protein
MTGKPSGEITKRQRRRIEREERARRMRQLETDIGFVHKFLCEATDKKEIARLRVKLRTLQQRLKYMQ